MSAPARHEFSASDVRPAEMNRLAKALVVPRPIAWVSTRSAGRVGGAGVDNLAPHSYFTLVSSRPLMVGFTSSGRKDTLANIEATEEFVVNVAPEPLFEQINDTSAPFPPEVSEFDAVGLAREPSRTVRPPRVAAAPAALECTLHSVVPLGDSFFVVGEVQHIAISDAVAEPVDGGVHPGIEEMNPLSRLGRDEWGVLGEVRSIGRPQLPKT